MYIHDKDTFDKSAPIIAGIDTLYYFYVTNDEYENLFLDIVDQIEDVKCAYVKRDIPYSNSDIEIEINGYRFVYAGKKEGFYWLNSLNSLFTFGFKDPLTNKRLNDIQVQLNAMAIYTIGLSAVLKLADDVVKGYITGLRPITRADMNVFVQADFSWVKSDMFIARQIKRETIIKEIGLSRKTQTIYIGNHPFLMRLYDKKEELKNSNKKQIMEEYFMNNEFDMKDPITNIEFECHRAYFKRFNIKTVDDFLENAEQLFKESMDAIRFVDLSSLSDKELLSNNRYRAETFPIWEYIKENYAVKEFMQLDLPLERMKRKLKVYTESDALKDFVSFNKRCAIHGVILDEQFFRNAQCELDQTFKRSCTVDYGLIYQQYLAPYRFPRVENLTDYELIEHHNYLHTEMKEVFDAYERAANHTHEVADEIKKRDLWKREEDNGYN